MTTNRRTQKTDQGPAHHPAQVSNAEAIFRSVLTADHGGLTDGDLLAASESNREEILFAEINPERARRKSCRRFRCGIRERQWAVGRRRPRSLVQEPAW